MEMKISPLRRKQSIFLKMEAQLVLKATALGTPIIRLEWMRSIERQGELFRTGKSKTMDSKHLTGLASDFAFLADIEDDGKINWHPDKYKELGKYWESLGGTWGGRFGDNPKTETIEGWDAGHFQL